MADLREDLYAADPTSFGRDPNVKPKGDADFRIERCADCFLLNLSFGRPSCDVQLPYPAARKMCSRYIETVAVKALDRTSDTRVPSDMAEEYRRLCGEFTDLGRRMQALRVP